MRWVVRVLFVVVVTALPALLTLDTGFFAGCAVSLASFAGLVWLYQWEPHDARHART